MKEEEEYIWEVCNWKTIGGIGMSAVALKTSKKHKSGRLAGIDAVTIMEVHWTSFEYTTCMIKRMEEGM